MTEPQTPSAGAEPISAVTLPDEPPPAAPEAAADAAPDILERLRPLFAHATLFAIGLGGGLAVAAASSLTLHYLGSPPDRQIASARIEIPARPPEPLDVEIQKAKAELDAALSKRNGG